MVVSLAPDAKTDVSVRSSDRRVRARPRYLRGRELARLRGIFERYGVSTEYGGLHDHGITHNSITGFADRRISVSGPVSLGRDRPDGASTERELPFSATGNPVPRFPSYRGPYAPNASDRASEGRRQLGSIRRRRHSRRRRLAVDPFDSATAGRDGRRRGHRRGRRVRRSLYRTAR